MRLARACALICSIAASTPAALASDLPSAAAALIERELPGYEWQSDAQQDGRHIGFGDFDANGKDDVAALLRGKDDWQLVVFRQLDGGRYRTHVIEQFPGDDREFKRRYPLDDLKVEVAAAGAKLEIDGTVVDDVAVHIATLALRLPPTEHTALLFKWDHDHHLFGTTRVRLAAARTGATCAYDPQSGKPNPLGMRALVTVEELNGNTTFVYEQFPHNLEGAAPATLATRRELVFHQIPIEQARALMRDEPGYYQELTGDDDPAGFAAVDASLVCH